MRIRRRSWGPWLGESVLIRAVWAACRPRHVGRICKLLNLDQLGSDPLKMPDDDPMLPPGSSTLKRQLACQAFNAVFFYDTFSEFRQGLNRNSLSYAFVAGKSVELVVSMYFELISRSYIGVDRLLYNRSQSKLQGDDEYYVDRAPSPVDRIHGKHLGSAQASARHALAPYFGKLGGRFR